VAQVCEELGYPATFTGRREYALAQIARPISSTITSGTGEAGNAVCKALFLGGVTRRFPRMRFAFLSRPLGCSVFADLIPHWDKRNGDVIRKLNPAN
jgi:hypothetical protein